MFTATIAVPAFLVYTVGFPLGTLYMLAIGTDALGLNSRTFDFVTEGYTEESRFFEPVIILRLGFLGISSVLFQSMVEIQIYAALMILFSALVINLRLKPFKTRGLNTIEEVTLIASWCTLFGGALLFSPKIELDWFKVVVTIMIFSANLGVFFFLIYSASLSLSIYLSIYLSLSRAHAGAQRGSLAVNRSHYSSYSMLLSLIKLQGCKSM